VCVCVWGKGEKKSDVKKRNDKSLLAFSFRFLTMLLLLYVVIVLLFLVASLAVVVVVVVVVGDVVVCSGCSTHNG